MNANSPDRELGFHGGDYKYAVSMSAEGFDMNTDDWKIIVRTRMKSVTFTPENSIHNLEEDQWYICLDTDMIETGQATITFEAHVPDTDFPKGYRREKETYRLIFLQP